MEDELLYFNGINGTTGSYLLPPMSPNDIGRIALGEKLEKGLKDELEWRKFQGEENYALKAGLDPADLSQTGWGVIFPAAWDEGTLAAVREALSELLDLRRSQAGERYMEFSGANGYRPNDSKDDFTSRHGAAPGPVDPAFLPYYLLIVGDPQTIPFRFQFELDVSYLVGRIYFSSLDEYAQYARSVATAEKPGAVQSARKAAFFGVANPNDKATALSSEYLVKPLAEKMKASQPDWEVNLLPPEETRKQRLLSLLGGDETPALLFTASHGMGYPYEDPRQIPFQGALLCQDWPGPGQKQRAVSRDDYLGGEDIASDASLLGTVCFTFACFGLGTPYWDDFSKQAFSTRSAIAPYAFLGALPQRLLSHPKGGALAVVGHVDRAWSFSFKWGEAGVNTVSFESSLTRLMSGETVGAALDDLNLRYAEIATMLTSAVEESEYQKPDVYKLARLWTAHNDARGYALLGDPAVRIPVTPPGSAAVERGSISQVEHRSGSLPPVASSQPPVPGTAAADQAVSSGAGYSAPAGDQAAAEDDLRERIAQLERLLADASELLTQIKKITG